MSLEELPDISEEQKAEALRELRTLKAEEEASGKTAHFPDMNPDELRDEDLLAWLDYKKKRGLFGLEARRRRDNRESTPNSSRKLTNYIANLMMGDIGEEKRQALNKRLLAFRAEMAFLKQNTPSLLGLDENNLFLRDCRIWEEFKEEKLGKSRLDYFIRSAPGKDALLLGYYIKERLSEN